MNSIKRFFRDETATAEATSTVIMIAAVGVLLAARLVVWSPASIPRLTPPAAKLGP